MAKKSFKDSAAAVFMSIPGKSQRIYAQEAAQEAAQEVTQEAAQEATQEVSRVSERRTARTQGRKGKKKSRINMAFEEEIYDYIQVQAQEKDCSMTQLVNDILYKHMAYTHRGKRK